MKQRIITEEEEEVIRVRRWTLRGRGSRGQPPWPRHTGVITPDTGRSHGVTAANQKALLSEKEPIRGRILWGLITRDLIQEQRVKIWELRADSDIHLWQGYSWSIFSKVWIKSTQCQCWLGVLWFVMPCVKLNNMNFRHQRAHKTFPITLCHLEDTHRFVNDYFVTFSQVASFPGQVSEDGD